MQVLDLLVQRFKAVVLSVQDGTWSAAKWLELLPSDPEGGATSLEEEMVVRKAQEQDLKLEKLLRDNQPG